MAQPILRETRPSSSGSMRERPSSSEECNEADALEAQVTPILRKTSNDVASHQRCTTYVEGDPRPMLRGALHFIALVSSPWWGSFALQHAGSTRTCRAVTITQVSCLVMGFFLSVIYHRFPWPTRKAELTARKADLMGIVFTIAGLATTSIALALPPIPRGTLLLYIWVFSGALCIAIASERFEPRIYVAFAAFIVVVGVPEAIYTKALLPREWHMLALALCMYALSAATFLNKLFNLCPKVWDSHDSFHFICVLGIICNARFNSFIVDRMCI